MPTSLPAVLKLLVNMHKTKQKQSAKEQMLLLTGMSSTAMQGMVAAYTGATSVSLARCAGQLRHTVDFANAFGAVSRGAAARVQGQPLEKLNMKGCIALRIDDIATLCHYFDTLRSKVLL